jgi:hypothetical protein
MLVEMVRAMQTVRDQLLNVSLMLQEHLFEIDEQARDQAREQVEAAIRRVKSR